MKVLIVVLLACFPLALATSGGQAPSYVPADGYVPDEATAIKIAEAVLVPIYGQEQIDREKPLHATLSRGVWTVSGILKEGRAGGVAIVKLRKKDGCILYVMHGR